MTKPFWFGSTIIELKNSYIPATLLDSNVYKLLAIICKLQVYLTFRNAMLFLLVSYWNNMINGFTEVFSAMK